MLSPTAAGVVSGSEPSSVLPCYHVCLGVCFTWRTACHTRHSRKLGLRASFAPRPGPFFSSVLDCDPKQCSAAVPHILRDLPPLINTFCPLHGTSHDAHGIYEVLIRLFDDHGLVAVINGDPLKKFLKRVLKAKPLKAGAKEPGLQKLLPANTYLLIVPPRSSATAVAIAVVDCCAREGDASEKEDLQPIPVKVRCILGFDRVNFLFNSALVMPILVCYLDI